MVLRCSPCSWQLRVDKATLNAMDREKITKERRMTERNRLADWTGQCRDAKAIEVPVSALGGTGLRMSRQAANEGRLHASTKLQFPPFAPTTRVKGPQVVAHLGISPENECWKRYALDIPDSDVILEVYQCTYTRIGNPFRPSH